MTIAVSTVHEANCWVVVILGLILNMLLIFLILKRTSKEMRIYSRILLQTSFIDFCGLLTTAFVQPIYLMYNGHNVVITNGLLRSFGQSWAFVMTMLWFFIGCFSIISNCVPFIYREKVISPLTYALILVICVFFSLIFVGAVIWATHPDNEQLMKINATTMELSNFLNQPSDMTPLRIGFMLKATILPVFELGPSMACLITSVFFSSSTNVYFISFATLSMHWVAVLNPLAAFKQRGTSLCTSMSTAITCSDVMIPG
ncbi:serpentine type 7TM GPCR chemoreceptor srd domain-containing protein [Ditylenchus destructor]|nr:serpentine type 7TM GPCR chemoreceptor srd domain-containing protein [Ditylenchus destructor]